MGWPAAGRMSPPAFPRRFIGRRARVLGPAALLLAARQAAAANVFSAPFAGGAAGSGVQLNAVTWNVAAVNNNPFEYWITHPNPAYKRLMEDVERYVVGPGAEDVRVDALFTDDMFRRVMARMEKAGIGQLDVVQKLWDSNYRGRRVVSEFLTDAEIGKKRLASMPDRVTNTIQLPNGESVFRPTVINCYEEQIGTLDEWFEKWLTFFFDTGVDLDGKGPRPVYSLLNKIKKSKYPAVTEEEEAASIPLQLVLQGVFDAILVNLMQTKGGADWQQLRKEICVSMNIRKNERLMDILQTTYANADVVFLQEVGNQFTEMLRARYGPTHHVVTPKSYSVKRNQNSVMLLRSSVFATPEEVEVPVDGWDAGDLLVAKSRVGGLDVNLASFHGDTNGLLTMPMLARVAEHLAGERLLFGMDANTYEKESKSTAHVLEFEQMYSKLGFKACWGKADPTTYTTFNARTYLQPQLNKAARSTQLVEKGDRNPKDFIIFTDGFAAGRLWRDNTGRGEYLEDVVFPTLEFPSDHAAVSVEIRLSAGGGGGGGQEL